MKTLTTFFFSALLTIFILQNAKAQTWEFVGLDSMIIYGLEVRGDIMWASTHDLSTNGRSGLYKSTKRGQTWIKLDSVLGNKTVTAFSIDGNNSSRLFMIKGYNHAGYFFRTIDDGLSWDSISTPGNTPIKDFIVSPLSASEYYVITYTLGHEWSIVQLFNKSTDAGNYWEYKCCPGDQEFGIVMAFAIDKNNPNILYISAGSAGTIFTRSTDRGETWQILSGPEVSRVFIDLFIPNRIYLFNYYDKIYSDDGGITWQNMSGEYSPDASFFSFYQDPNTSVIYALLNEGLFYSDNDSIYWKLIPGSEILSVIPPIHYSTTIRNISTDNNYIYVGTASGIYKTDFITGIDDQQIDLNPEAFYLSQNYPNPFNPTTTISYQIPENSFVTLKVYDVLGNEIATLVNEEKPVGNYEVAFDASEFVSGIYFYRLQASESVESKKMVLTK